MAGKDWHAHATVDDEINDMMAREEGAGQRFPHGSQLPEEELRVSCNLDSLWKNFCLIN